MKRKETFKLTFSAIMAAMTVAVMYFGSIFPTGKLGFLGIASLFAVAAVIECGAASGAAVYVVSSVLGLLLIPDKALVIVYLLFFGFYPVVKYFAEKTGKKAVCWIIKLTVVNAALTVLVLAFKDSLLAVTGLEYQTAVIYAVVNAVFVLFDIGVTGLIGIYMSKIHSKLAK